MTKIFILQKKEIFFFIPYPKISNIQASTPNGYILWQVQGGIFFTCFALLSIVLLVSGVNEIFFKSFISVES